MKLLNSRWHCSGGIIGILVVAMLGLATGCRDNSPPPPRVPVPASDDRTSMSPQPAAQPMARHTQDSVKPLPPPEQSFGEFQPPFDDVPIVSQRPPEQPAFVNAYRRVGSPRITLFVNRTLEGNIIAVNPSDPVVSAQVTKKSSAGNEQQNAAIYLRPGQYDEVKARSLDYQAIETIMTDWLAANGQVTIISPTMARQRLTDQQVKELQEGRPTALSEIAQQLGADVLIQVQAHPTRQTADGLEVRIVAEAMNTRGGESIGRAVVDIPPPLVKTTINRYTRFLARKLMDDMISTWELRPAPPAQQQQPPAPQAPAQQPPVNLPPPPPPTTQP